eukprot:362975-Chlamydomonas_euryale.AAC.2
MIAAAVPASSFLSIQHPLLSCTGTFIQTQRDKPRRAFPVHLPTLAFHLLFPSHSFNVPEEAPFTAVLKYAAEEVG